MITVCHVITGLGLGGAERTLERLVRAGDSGRFRGSIVSLLPRGPYAAAIESHGWKVQCLDMGPGLSASTGTRRLYLWLRQERPDVVQTWMYHADLLGGLAARWAGCHRVVWNVRRSAFPVCSNESNRTTRVVARASVPLSQIVPRLIVCGSHAARVSHRNAGYPVEKLRVIPNGIEVPPPLPHARRNMRRQLGLSDDTVLIGRVARYDPIKDYPTFLQAAAILVQRGFAGQFLLCGENVCESNTELVEQIRSLRLVGRCHLLGPRQDVALVHGSLDLACSSSSGEGFPNVVAEAMAAGVPCVVTDVGDSAKIVGKTGQIVPPRSPASLASALWLLAEAGPDTRRRLGQAARRRITARFTLERMVRAYEAMYSDLVDHVRN